MNILKLLGFQKKAAPAVLSPVDNRGWQSIIRESYAGAWQRGESITLDNVTAFGAVYACTTLIATDVAKLRLKLVRRVAGNRWQEVFDGSPWLAILRKPNAYQTRSQFFEAWVICRLLHGNSFILKVRDNRGMVKQLKLLDPQRVQPVVADTGDIYYRLQADNLSGIDQQGLTIPASEIIHDRAACLHHPLVGVSPIYACGYSAAMGLNVTKNSKKFFENGARPGGLITAPGSISEETAKSLKEFWDTNFRGDNAGRVAVVGDGLKYEAMTMTATDAQLIEQLKWSAEDVARAFHVPAHMIGAGQVPNYATVEQLTSAYYSQTLQAVLESMESVLDDGLEFDSWMGVEFDTTQLMRMDTTTRWKAYGDAIGGGWMSPNEAREREDLGPVEGGGTPYLQQQNFSLQALSRRDADADPFNTGKSLPGKGEMWIRNLREVSTLQSKGYRPRLRWSAAASDWIEVA